MIPSRPRSIAVLKVLVVGATGNQGSAVVRHSLEAGLAVAGLVRDPAARAAKSLTERGVELRQGDLDRPDTLASAFEGIDAVFSVQNFWRTGHVREVLQAKAVVEAARAAGVEYFIQTTGGLPPGSGVPNVEVKSVIEALVREAFPGAFILRPVWFIDGLNLTSFNLEAGTLEFVTAPDQPHAWVAIDDIGQMAARAFAHFDSVAGLTLKFASRVNTGVEIAAAFNGVFGTSFRYHQFSEAEQEAKVLSLGLGPEFTHELRATFNAIRNVNFAVDLPLHDRLLPDRHTVSSWTREFAYPLWREGLSG